MKRIIRKAPALAKASSWFYGLPARDQLSLKCLSVAMLAFLLYIVIWVPVQDSLKAAKLEVRQNYNDLVWMMENESKARSLAKTSDTRPTAKISGQSLLSTISTSAQNFGIELQRFEPRGDNKVNIWLDKVSFNQLMLWLSDLNVKFGVSAEQVNIDKSDRPGEVTARLSLTI